MSTMLSSSSNYDSISSKALFDAYFPGACIYSSKANRAVSAFAVSSQAGISSQSDFLSELNIRRTIFVGQHGLSLLITALLIAALKVRIALRRSAIGVKATEGE